MQIETVIYMKTDEDNKHRTKSSDDCCVTFLEFTNTDKHRDTLEFRIPIPIRVVDDFAKLGKVQRQLSATRLTRFQQDISEHGIIDSPHYENMEVCIVFLVAGPAKVHNFPGVGCTRRKLISDSSR